MSFGVKLKNFQFLELFWFLHDGLGTVALYHVSNLTERRPEHLLSFGKSTNCFCDYVEKLRWNFLSLLHLTIFSVCPNRNWKCTKSRPVSFTRDCIVDAILSPDAPLQDWDTQNPSLYNGLPTMSNIQPKVIRHRNSEPQSRKRTVKRNQTGDGPDVRLTDNHYTFF